MEKSRFELIEGMEGDAVYNAGLAIAYARERFQIDLDCSVESILLVEQVLDKILMLREDSDRYRELANQTAAKFGCYLGEIFRAQLGGAWGLLSRASPGEQSPAVGLEGHAYLPNYGVYKWVARAQRNLVWDYYLTTIESVALSPGVAYDP